MEIRPAFLILHSIIRTVSNRGRCVLKSVLSREIPCMLFFVDMYVQQSLWMLHLLIFVNILHILYLHFIASWNKIEYDKVWCWCCVFFDIWSPFEFFLTEWYFVSKTVCTYVRKKSICSDGKKLLQIQCWRPRVL